MAYRMLRPASGLGGGGRGRGQGGVWGDVVERGGMWGHDLVGCWVG